MSPEERTAKVERECVLGHAQGWACADCIASAIREAVAAEREGQVGRVREAIEACAKLLESHAEEILKSAQGLDTGVLHRASAWRWAASAIRLQKPSESAATAIQLAAQRGGDPQ